MKNILIVILLLVCTNVWSYRISRPDTFTLPWDADQMNRLNDALSDIWNLQNGEFNFDIVTTPKTRADQGDIWFIQTGSVVYIQYRANGQIYTVAPQ